MELKTQALANRYMKFQSTTVATGNGNSLQAQKLKTNFNNMTIARHIAMQLSAQ